MPDETNNENTETRTETTDNRPIARPVIRMLGKATGRGSGRRKVCRFCADTTVPIDYKNPQILKNFITDRGKITPRRISGNCAKHQRALSVAIRRARMIALLPFTVTGR